MLIFCLIEGSEASDRVTDNRHIQCKNTAEMIGLAFYYHLSHQTFPESQYLVSNSENLYVCKSAKCRLKIWKERAKPRRETIIIRMWESVQWESCQVRRPKMIFGAKETISALSMMWSVILPRIDRIDSKPTDISRKPCVTLSWHGQLATIRTWASNLHQTVSCWGRQIHFWQLAFKTCIINDVKCNTTKNRQDWLKTHRYLA